jgi:hypothetical protein
LCIASPICFRLFVHCARRAASRADWTAGKSNAIKTAMIAITTRSSINVKPDAVDRSRLRNPRKHMAAFSLEMN